jgi:hypothetical protein
MIYQPSSNSLKKHLTPQWFKDDKFGIYTHWGIYCVPAKGPNATWYPVWCKNSIHTFWKASSSQIMRQLH